MDKKNFVVVIYPSRVTGEPLPASLIHFCSLDYMMSHSFYLEYNGVLLCEYIDGFRSKVVKVNDGKYFFYLGGFEK